VRNLGKGRQNFGEEGEEGKYRRVREESLFFTKGYGDSNVRDCQAARGRHVDNWDALLSWFNGKWNISAFAKWV
jgi:hypothetical protein